MKAQLFFVTLIFSLLVLLLTFKANGFTMEMIPINSPQLQILPQQFTTQEINQFLIDISIRRAYKTPKSNTTLPPNTFAWPLSGDPDGFYFTSVTIGITPEGNAAYEGYMMLDTGDDNTWVQCVGCQPCFTSMGTNFDYTKSSTYALMSPNDQLCNTRIVYRGSCGYQVTYITGQSTKGMLGRDRFIFKNSMTGQLEVYPDLVFGCGLENPGHQFSSQSEVTGLMGLSPGPRSFLTQLRRHIRGRFSYCLRPAVAGKALSSTMYFGDDAQIDGGGKTIQVISMQSSRRYHLYITGISVDGKRLAIDPSVFDFDPRWLNKGFFIDSGAPYTVLTESAYEPFFEAIAEYFGDKYNWGPRPLTSNLNSFRICYDYPQDYDQVSFPSVIFHFRGRPGTGGEVKMVFKKGNMFLKLVAEDQTDVFCAMVLHSDDPSPSLLGAFQQVNFRFLYDVTNSLMFFVPEICK